MSDLTEVDITRRISEMFDAFVNSLCTNVLLEESKA